MHGSEPRAGWRGGRGKGPVYSHQPRSRGGRASGGIRPRAGVLSARRKDDDTINNDGRAIARAERHPEGSCCPERDPEVGVGRAERGNPEDSRRAEWNPEDLFQRCERKREDIFHGFERNREGQRRRFRGCVQGCQVPVSSVDKDGRGGEEGDAGDQLVAV